MKNKIALFVSALGLTLLTLALPVAAESVFDDSCTGPRRDNPICENIDNAEDNVSGFIQDIVSILMFALGAISVIVIIVGGIRYATADGDSGKISQAKNTILYAVIGLVVALLAYAITFFVLEQF